MPLTDRLLVILDLDETLVHSSERPLARASDFTLGPYQVYLRPGLQHFVSEILDRFQVAVWSSGSDDYVAALVNRIFSTPERLAFCWGRSRCTAAYDAEFQETQYVKDLKKVRRRGFRLGRVVIVDDTPGKVQRNYGNAIYVLPYTGQNDDNELELLLGYLESLAAEADVCAIEKRGWRRRSV